MSSKDLGRPPVMGDIQKLALYAPVMVGVFGAATIPVIAVMTVQL